MADYSDPFTRNNDAAAQARTKPQARVNVLQMKLMGQGHSTGLTPNLLKLFVPRPPLEYKLPLEKRKCPSYTGMAQFVSRFAEPGDPEYAPPVDKAETRAQKKARIQKLRVEKGATKAAEDLQKYDLSKDRNISGDPYKTLFVAKLNYDTTEHRIKKEFEVYGSIKWVRLITDKVTNKPRGYAFIEYMHTRDMKTAYKQADGRKMDNGRVFVDVERGRTVPNWRPRRLGGGLGSTRLGAEEVQQRHSDREPQRIGSEGPPRLEEPRVLDDRRHDRPREASRERGKDEIRERERSREVSHSRLRDRGMREDRHHCKQDRDRYRDKEGERDRGRDRDRVRSRDKERDRSDDHDREHDRDHDHPREKNRMRDEDYDRASHVKDRGDRHGRDIKYDRLEPAHHREQSPVRKRDQDTQELYEPIKHVREHDYDRYDQSRNPEHLGETVHNQEQLKRHESDSHESCEEGEAIEEYDHHRSERDLP